MPFKEEIGGKKTAEKYYRDNGGLSQDCGHYVAFDQGLVHAYMHVTRDPSENGRGDIDISPLAPYIEIQRLDLKDRVLLPGFQKNPYPWVRHADLFVMSSDSEGLPTVLIEALILGTPVVSTDCPTGPGEILTGELKQFLSPPGDPETLAQNIKRALVSYPEITEREILKFEDRFSARQYIEHCTNDG